MFLISRSVFVLAAVGLAVGCSGPLVTTAPQPTASPAPLVRFLEVPDSSFCIQSPCFL